jgi:hypothetical protein
MREAEEKCLQLFGCKETYGKKKLGRLGVEGRIILKVKASRYRPGQFLKVPGV